MISWVKRTTELFYLSAVLFVGTKANPHPNVLLENEALKLESETFMERFLYQSILPTPAPTAICHDDNSFNTIIRGHAVTCEYIAFTQYREHLCERKVRHHGTEKSIKVICPKACEFNCVPTAAPTPSCHDHDDFSADIKGKTVTCDYVRFSPDDIWYNLCQQEVPYKGVDKKLKELCPLACDHCDPSPSPVPHSNPPTSPPTSPPTPCNKRLTDQERIEILKQKYRDLCNTEPNDSDQSKAFDFVLDLTNDDCPQVDPVDLQRYVAALFYYSTGGDNWTDKGTYLSKDLDECDWSGIKCDSAGKITIISQNENNLVGTLPSELECLPELTQIQADDNFLTGSIPNEYTNIPKLEVVDLDNNKLTGTIPVDIGKCQKLRIWDTDQNLMTGSIPSSMFNIGTLQALDINSNSLTGTISPAFSRLRNLELLQIYDNAFSGKVPASMRLLTTLNEFSLFENDISGVMPAGVCGLRDGDLQILIADCGGSGPKITCDCCSRCLTPSRSSRGEETKTTSFSRDW